MEIPAPKFEIFETVEPTQDAAIKHGGPGKVEHRSWVEYDQRPGYWRYTVRWPGQGTSSESDEHLQVADRLMCDLRVVVSGAPFKFESWTTESVDVLIERALEKAGVVIRPDEWTLRSSKGVELKHLVGDAELVDGETLLYLDPQVGGGGELRDNPHLSDEQRAEFEDRLDQLRYVEGWQGTPPAEGTRRALIRDAIYQAIGEHFEDHGGRIETRSSFALKIADAIEEALLRVVDQGATPESGSPASVAMDLLDSFEIPRTREGAILTIADRVTALADLLVEARRERDVKQATLEGLAATVTAKADALEGRVEGLMKLTSRVGGDVPPQTRELVIVLEDVSDPDGPPEYRFVEIENQDGRSIGSFPIRSSEQPPLKEIVIPYGRDNAWVSEVAYQAAGAATRPLLEDHPGYTFPAERVRDAVAGLLSDFGIPRACTDCAEEQLEHGRKEVDDAPGGDDPAATIKYLEGEVERLLGHREEARTREGRFAEERDCAFALLRWLLPVTVAKRLDS